MGVLVLKVMQVIPQPACCKCLATSSTSCRASCTYLSVRQLGTASTATTSIGTSSRPSPSSSILRSKTRNLLSRRKSKDFRKCLAQRTALQNMRHSSNANLHISWKGL